MREEEEELDWQRQERSLEQMVLCPHSTILISLINYSNYLNLLNQS